MDEQEIVRNKVIKFMDNYGTKQNWLCSKVNVPTYVFCKWLKGEKSLYDSSLEDVDMFLKSKGY